MMMTSNESPKQVRPKECRQFYLKYALHNSIRIREKKGNYAIFIYHSL
jgi:hypothetical protein